MFTATGIKGQLTKPRMNRGDLEPAAGGERACNRVNSLPLQAGVKAGSKQKSQKTAQEVQKRGQEEGVDGRDAGGAGCCGEGCMNSFPQGWQTCPF